MKIRRDRPRVSNRKIRRLVKDLDWENRALRACLGAACRERVEELTADLGELGEQEAGLPAFSFAPEDLQPGASGEAYLDEHGEHVVVRWIPPPRWREVSDEGETGG